MLRLTAPTQYTQTPVDRNIFGCFIEAGFGRQLPGMWSEMLFNRGFRKNPPYNIATWEWLGIEEAMYNENAPFWHSGYEEHDWEAVGEPKISHTLGSRTFKGLTSLRLTGKEGEGVSQQGLHLQKGRSYCFSILAGLDGWLSRAGLNGFGDSTYAEVTRPIHVRIGSQRKEFVITPESLQYDWEFTADETAVTSIEITLGFEGGVFLSWASLMPADNVDGWRRDVIDTLRQTGVSAVRFPGGCYASFYDWRATVGDRGNREPQTSFYWGGLEENDVGVDEFMRLCELCGFEAQFCFNMMSSDPFHARELVEYLNAPADVGCGRLRTLNGREQPYGVRLFEMDNEPGRKWSGPEYARQCVRFAQEMRQADPTIQFMFAAYTYPLEALPAMLEIAGHDIDYVIYRQGDPAFVQKALEIIREYNAQNGTSLKLTNTEWLPRCSSIEPIGDGYRDDFRWTGAITNDYKNIFSTYQLSWNYALNGAHRLMDYMTYGGEFALANFNNMCNTWGQNIMEGTKDACFLSNMGEVFAFFHRHFRPCRAAVVPGSDRRLFAVSALDEDGGEVMYVVNHSSEAVEAALPAGAWVAGEGICARTRMSMVRENAPCVQRCEPVLGGGTVTLPPLSLCVLERR